MIKGLLLILFSVSFLTCSLDSNKEAKKSIFHYNQPNPITSLDPAFAKTQNNYWACEHLYNQLLDLDDSLHIVPELAKYYTISEEGKLYTFILRNDVYFTGNKCFKDSLSRVVNASDVAFSFYRLLDTKLSAPGRWIFVDKIDSINGFKALNDTVFQLRLKRPFAPLLSLLTMHYCSIIPEEAIDYYKDKFRENPVGTGPFVLTNWVDRQGMFFRKNTNYFKNGKPHLDGIRISFIEDRNTAYLEFMKKRIDYFSGIHSSFAPQLINRFGMLRDDRVGMMNFMRGTYLNTEYIGINVNAVSTNHALRNKYIRQALNLAINKELMVQTFKYGIGKAANSGFIPPGLTSFDSVRFKGYSYDPDSARALLKLAGYSNLKKDEQQLVLYTNKDFIDLITFVARQWQEVGIDVKIELLETATLREKMRAAELPIFRASWIADYPDEESFLTVFYGPNSSPPNYTRFQNQQFDLFYEDAMKETDPELRKDLYQKMNKIIIDEAPVVFLLYDEVALFSQNNIHGIIPNAINLLKLEDVKKLIIE
ncbi:MAG: ABC transporter substrate-binding protein [Saprospiraceae bacterium]|nr:ABC transporter substrate-binding protein [Saprospiraceae bacterium]